MTDTQTLTLDGTMDCKGDLGVGVSIAMSTLPNLG